MAFIIQYVCEALGALDWIGLAPPQLHHPYRKWLLPLPTGCIRITVLCGMLQRPTSPSPEGNLTDNPGRKLKLPTYSIIFSYKKFFLILY